MQYMNNAGYIIYCIAKRSFLLRMGLWCSINRCSAFFQQKIGVLNPLYNYSSHPILLAACVRTYVEDDKMLTYRPAGLKGAPSLANAQGYIYRCRLNPNSHWYLSQELSLHSLLVYKRTANGPCASLRCAL